MVRVFSACIVVLFFFSCKTGNEQGLPEFKSNSEYDPCFIIRNVEVEQGTNKQYALLDICPDDMEEDRPYIDIGDEDEAIYVEYDLMIVFPDKDSAYRFAQEKNILDIQ